MQLRSSGKAAAVLGIGSLDDSLGCGASVSCLTKQPQGRTGSEVGCAGSSTCGDTVNMVKGMAALMSSVIMAPNLAAVASQGSLSCFTEDGVRKESAEPQGMQAGRAWIQLQLRDIPVTIPSLCKEESCN